MAKTYIQPGHTLTIPSPGAIAPGDVVVVGEIIGVAAGAAALGEPADVHVVGVWSLPKVAGDDMSVGEAIFWDSAAGLATVTATGNTRLGVAVAAGAATVAVRLSGF